jgi:phosphocarrier protein
MTDWLTGEALITHDVGLHARPSVRLTKLAKGFESRIEIAGSPDGPWVDAKSIVKVMAMKAKQNTVLHIRASGGDAEAAVRALRDLVIGDFKEDGLVASGS